jgi:hypothetical protein
MTRDETVKLLIEIKNYLCSGNPIWDVSLIDEALREAIVDVTIIPQILKDWNSYQWIPVSDRPPAKDDQYLTYHSTHGHPYYRTCGFANNLYKVDKYDFHDCKGKAGFYDLDSEYGYYKIDDVEAWMEIPKYKEKETIPNKV